VARVGHEGPLSGKRCVDAGEHVVERLAEAAQLVARLGEGQPLAASRPRDLAGPRPHRLDRAQGPRGDQVAEGRGRQQGERAGDEQLPGELGDGLVAVPERRAHDHGARVAGRPGEEPDGAVDGRGGIAVEGDRAGHRAPRLVRAQERRPQRRRGRVEHTPVRVDDLREALLEVGEAQPGRLGEPRGRGHHGCQLVGARAQRRLDPVLDPPRQADPEEHGDDREHDGHRERERQGQPPADRQPSDHGGARRR
jgi:hypothetical protein